MNLSYSDIRRFDDKLDLVLANQAEIKSSLAVLTAQGAQLMATVAELKAQLDQNTADLRSIGQAYLDFILAKDAMIAELNAAFTGRRRPTRPRSRRRSWIRKRRKMRCALACRVFPRLVVRR